MTDTTDTITTDTTTTEEITLVIPGLPQVINMPIGKTTCYGMIRIDLDRLPVNALQYLFRYGITQAFNDKTADKFDKNKKLLPHDQIVAKAQSRLDALYKGTIKTRGTGNGESADPYMAEATKEAKATVWAALVKANRTRDIPKGTTDKFMFVVNRVRGSKGQAAITLPEYLAAYFATPKGKETMARARATVDARTDDDEDIADLI